jgi:hypothetical protein
VIFIHSVPLLTVVNHVQVKKTAADLAKACGVRVAVPDLYRSKVAYEVSSWTISIISRRMMICQILLNRPKSLGRQLRQITSCPVLTGLVPSRMSAPPRPG